MVMTMAEKKKLIAVVGPPHSGKSVFLSCVFLYLQKKYPSQKFFLQRACPDGEGNWSAESDQDLVKKIRKKGNFNDQFINFTIKSIENLSQQFFVVFVDCGGRITKENLEIISVCTHFILLSSNRNATEDWMNFCQDICDCKAVAVLDSTLDLSKEPYYDSQKKIGRLVHLDRERVPENTVEVIHKIVDNILNE
jgi:CRISPR-associated protein Csx3